MIGDVRAIRVERRNDFRSDRPQAARKDPVDFAKGSHRLARLRALGRSPRNIARAPVEASVGELPKQRLVGFDVEKPLRIGRELSSPKLYIAILRPIDRRGIKVAADQQRRVPIVSFDDIEKMRNLRLPLDGARIALEMHRYESHPNPGNLDLRADRHAAADPLLAARRSEPAAIGLEAHHERTMKAEAANQGIAVKSEQVLLAGACKDLVLVAEIELDKLDAISKGVPQPSGQLRKAMPVPRPDHALVDLAEQDDLGLMPGKDRANRFDMPKALDVPDGNANRSVGAVAVGFRSAQLNFPERGKLTEIPLVRLKIKRSGAHRLPKRKLDLRDAADLRFNRHVDRPFNPLRTAPQGRCEFCIRGAVGERLIGITWFHGPAHTAALPRGEI